MRRAGMDYWFLLDLKVYENYGEFLSRNPGAKVYMATTKAQKVYTEVSYESDAFIMFGKESAGGNVDFDCLIVLIDNRDTDIRRIIRRKRNIALAGGRRRNIDRNTFRRKDGRGIAENHIT